MVRTARDVGFTSPLTPVPALALGSFEVTPLELGSAYAALANGGRPPAPSPVRTVARRDGTVVVPRTAGHGTGVSAEEAFLLTHLLRGVVDRGTGASVRALGLAGAVAGKTGTTNDARDAWFAGYSPRLVAVVWVGFDGGEALALSGAQAALPIWTDFMRAAAALENPGEFAVPPLVSFREIDRATGRLGAPACGAMLSEAFLPLTEPEERCGPVFTGAASRGDAAWTASASER